MDVVFTFYYEKNFIDLAYNLVAFLRLENISNVLVINFPRMSVIGFILNIELESK